jgi:hypothetical protein
MFFLAWHKRKPTIIDDKLIAFSIELFSVLSKTASFETCKRNKVGAPLPLGLVRSPALLPGRLYGKYQFNARFVR